MGRLSIFNFNSRNVLSFVGVILFTGAIFVVFFELLLSSWGETLSYKEVLSRQQISPQRFERMYFDVGLDYKILGAEQTEPDVLVLGTSRIAILSADYFQKSQVFYNAAVAASISKGIDGWLEVIKRLEVKGKLPRLIILGLDPWTLNPNAVERNDTLKHRIVNYFNSHPFLRKFYDGYSFTKDRLSAYQLLSQELKGIIWQGQLKNSQAIGLKAKMYDAGYDQSGVFRFPAQYEIKPLRSLEVWKEMLQKRDFRLGPAQEFDSVQVAKLKKFLEYCRNKDVNVIGVMFPIRSDLYEALSLLDSHKEYLALLNDELPTFFIQAGFKYFNYLSPDSLGLVNTDFYDEYHIREESLKKIPFPK